MKRYVLAMMLACFLVTPVQAKGALLELYEVSLPKALTLIYSQLFQRPFMLHPDLHKDERTMTLLLTPEVDAEQFVRRYLANMNIAIHRRDGVDYLAPKVNKPVPVRLEAFVYEPRFRSVAYLTDLLRSQFSGRFSANNGVGSASQLQPGEVEPGTASAVLNRAGDVLVYYGPEQDIQRLQAVLPLIDTEVGEVLVRGYVFEVQTTERNGSGMAVAAKLLSGRFGIEIGASQGFSNLVSINTPSLDAIFEMFSTDGRFHVLSAPMLRVKSGAQASFSVGAEVPVLGSVVLQDRNSVQSVEYRSSGVIFEVSPELRRDVIDLGIRQQLSNFVKTDTGVNNSPTLIKRDVSTAVTMGDGDIILLSGLAENKDSDASTGLPFLPGFFTGKSSENSKTDIIVILQASRITR